MLASLPWHTHERISRRVGFVLSLSYLPSSLGYAGSREPLVRTREHQGRDKDQFTWCLKRYPDSPRCSSTGYMAWRDTFSLLLRGAVMLVQRAQATSPLPAPTSGGDCPFLPPADVTPKPEPGDSATTTTPGMSSRTKDPGSSSRPVLLRA